MKEFRFRLESLLKIRERNQQDALQRLGETERRCQSAVNSLAELTTEKSDLASALNNTADTNSIHLNFARLATAQGDEVEARTRLQAAECLRDQDREKLVEAHRAQKALTTLRERQQKDYLRTLARRESAAMDEIGTTIAVRKQAKEKDAAKE